VQLCREAAGGAISGRLSSGRVVERTRAVSRARGAARIVLALAAVLAGASCSPPGVDLGAPDVTVGCRIEPSPPARGPARVELSLADPDGQPVEARSVRLEANMNHAGMVPVLAELRPAGPGRFSADIEFTMAGDWYVLVDATLADGRTLQRRFDVTGVRAP
jgi:hypothetical protein